MFFQIYTFNSASVLNEGFIKFKDFSYAQLEQYFKQCECNVDYY